MAVSPSASYSITARVEMGRHELHEGYVIPSVFNKKVAPAVAREVIAAARKGGVARGRRRAGRH